MMLKDASNSHCAINSPANPHANSQNIEDVVKANEVLMTFMNEVFYEALDNDNEDAERDKVVGKLDSMVRAWAKETGAAKGISEELLENGGGIQHFLFGSTMLKVHNIDSDIDIVCVAPSFISKDDFFNSFCERLAESTDVDSLLSIPEAYTPVIKFVMDGQSVDMVFASLQLPSLPVPIDVYDLKYLKGLDEQSVRSLNGVRVAHWITRLIPDIENYRIALRIIKYWAKERGIYSNILGFLGGVNYAILVAFICKLYPQANPFVLVERFFAVYTMWQWPTPIMLKEYEDLEFQDSDGRYMAVWNPMVNYKDALHMMPIITPAYPSMNSAYNIAQPQFRCIQEEIYRGQALFQEYPRGVDFPWKVLLEPSTKEFFTRYPRYIQIDITATSPGDHRSWFGWVESRLRSLIVALEQPPSIFCHPTANCFHRQPNSSFKSPSKTKQYFSVLPTNTVVHGEEKQPYSQPSSAITTPPYSNTSSPTNMELGQTSDIASTSTFTKSEVADEKMETEENCSANKNDADDVEASDESKALQVEQTCQSNNNSADANQVRVSIGHKSPFETPPRKRGSQQEMPASDDTDNLYVSSFFIGLSFRKGLPRADVSHTIQEFSEKVNCWKSKTNGMTLNITSCDGKSVPPFVEITKAKPSNIESCTPKLPRQKQLGTTPSGTTNIHLMQSPSAALHHLDYSQYASPNKPISSSSTVQNGSGFSANAEVLENTYASVLANGGSSKSLRTTPLASPNRSSQSQSQRQTNNGNSQTNYNTNNNPFSTNSNSANPNPNRFQDTTRRTEPSHPAPLAVPPAQPMQQPIQNHYQSQQSFVPHHEYAVMNSETPETMMSRGAEYPSSAFYPRGHADRSYSDDFLIRGNGFLPERQFHVMSRHAYNYSPESFGNNQQSVGNSGNMVNNNSNNGGAHFASYHSYDNYLNNLNHRNSGSNKSFPRRPMYHHQHQQQQQQPPSPNRPHNTYRSYSLGNIGPMYYASNNGMDGDAMSGNGMIQQHQMIAPPPYLNSSVHGSMSLPPPPHHTMPASMPVHSPAVMRRNNMMHVANAAKYPSSNNSLEDEDYHSQAVMNPPPHSASMLPDNPSHVFPPLTFGAIRPPPPNSGGNGNTSTTSTITTGSNEMMEGDAMSIGSNEFNAYGNDETFPTAYYIPHHSHTHQNSVTNPSMTPNSTRLFRKELPTGKEYGHKKQ